MAKIESLLQQAAVIRDATAEGENTAVRVGSLFVSLVQAIVDTLPPELLDATGISYSAGESNFIVTVKSLTDEGKSASRQIIIPAASQGNAGLLTPAKLKEINDAVKQIAVAVSDVASALEDASGALKTAGEAKAMAGNAQDNANIAIQRTDTLTDRVSQVEDDTAEALSELQRFKDTRGKNNGLAPLDDSGKVPSRYIPGSYDDVVEFNATVSDITVLQTKAPKKSTDVGCMVVYDADRDLFVLAVSLLSAGITTDKDWSAIVRPQRASLIAPQADATTGQKIQITDVWQFDEAGGAYVKIDMFQYYYDWEDAESWGPIHDEDEMDGHEGMSGKIYTCTSNNKTYRWSGAELITIGSDLALGHTASTAFPGDEGAHLQDELSDLQDEVGVKADSYDLQRVEQEVSGIKIYPFDGILSNNTTNFPKSGIYYFTNSDGSGYFKDYTTGSIGLDAYNDFAAPDAISPMVARTDVLFRYRNNLYRYDDGELKEVGGGSSTGNVVNIHEITKDWNASNRGEAAAKVPDKLRTGGRKITFMSAAGKWQTWQFTGSLASDWSKEEYWRQEIRSLSMNGTPCADPDRDGNVDITYEVPVDQTLNGESERAVCNKAVVSGLNEVRDTIPAKFGWDNNSRQLSLLSAEGEALDTVTIPGGGGGGDVNPTAIEITVQSALQTTVKEGDDCVIEYLWRHYNINNNVDTQYGGTAELLVGGAVVDRQIVTQGFNTFNAGPWLQSGLNSVRIRITADDGLISQSATIKITAAALSLRSLYDISTANAVGSNAHVRYIVNGSGDKEVTFEMDGKETAETIKTSGATSIKTLGTSAFYHSVHTLTMQARRDLGGGSVLETEPVVLDMMFVSRDSYKPLIALQRPQTAQQYSTIEIPFAVYDPENAQSAIVEIYLGDTLVERQRVDRSLHTFSYRVRQYGPQTFTFKVQNSHLSTENEITIDVLQAATQIEAETDGLSLYLSASGRSNDADNRDDWSFTSEQGWKTVAEFHGVKFDAQSGWRKDSNGITALHLEKGATCFIPFTPFSTDAKQSGKTIEIEFAVSKCFDTTASIISCMAGNVGFDIKAQEAAISSALRKTVGTKFKQDERIRVGFVIEQVAGTNRFMHLFVNGKHSGVVQYDTNDYFVQNPAQGITLGNASCELNVYIIRIYEQALAFRQMLNNRIADMDDTGQMFAKLEANDIFNDESGEDEISFDKAVKKIACLRYIGELPKYKGDKKIGWLVYEDPEHPEDNFMVLVQIDVQGTSSQYYVVKNYKVKFKDVLQMTNKGTTAKTFALRAYDQYGNAIPQKAVKTFCLKADFAESSGTHNTGAANMIDEILKAAGILTPMQEKDSTVRTTIYGHPCLLFHQESESSPIRFLGKYNFNNDKSTHETFGFQDIEGFNKGMVNRDDYLVWDGRLSELQGNADALAAAEDADATYYLIENAADSLNNHLVEYDETAGAWVDRGEMWRWKAHLMAWGKNDGSTCTRAQGILDKVAAGELVENNIECWEFLNNGHPMCLFHSSDYTTQVSSGLGSWIKEAWLNKTDAEGKKAGPYWSGAFEPRYPDNDDNNIRYARGKVPEQLKRVTDWLASLAINDEKLTEAEKQAKTQLFAGQISSYFNKRMALAYDLIKQGFVAADQGAKNMMWAIIDGIIYIIFYDNDTIWLINNEGRIMFIPYVECHSVDELGKYVFNGESSTLWNHIERGLQSEERQLYADMVAAGFTYERALFWFNERQSDKWCEAVKNADSKYKYIDSFGNLSEDGSGQTNNYLDMAQGDREEHRKWAMQERFQYQNAKWGAGSFRESRIYLRANTAGESTVPAKVAVDLTAAQDWYFAFRFSANDGWNPQRIEAGQTVHFEAPAGSIPNDTETYIHQADRLSDIGDISTLYPTTCDIAQGRMLRQLVVGNKTEGYRGKLAELTFGSHPLMRYINVVNIPTLASTLNLTGCTALEEIEAQGSGITGLNLPAGSSVKKMHLPATIVNLEFDQLPNLTNANLVVDGYGKVQTVNITDCALLNPMAVLDAVTATRDNSLMYVRVTGVTLRGTGEELIRLIEMGVHGARDRNGKPEVLGTYHLTKLPESNELDIIIEGINPDGFTVEIVVEAFTGAMDEVNGATYGGEAEVEAVDMDNVIDHIRYYNGETAEEALARLTEENRDIHELITL